MNYYVLSSSHYENQETNYGDCIVIDTKNKLFVYDCGSDEHAYRVINYMKEKGYTDVEIILSHNDSDHFNGIDLLLDKGVVKCIHTVLLFKHLDDLLERIDDGRRNKNGLKEQIKELYDNIASLSGKCTLIDAIDEDIISGELEIVGPSKDYILDAVAKYLNNNESDTIDNTSIPNATSIQVKVTHPSLGNILLTGDASFEAIEDKLLEYDVIQLPHHGNKDVAEQVFEKIDSSDKPNNNIIYIISDNTGNSNGGSDKLEKEGFKGHRVISTKDGDINLNELNKNLKTCGTYGESNND